MTSSRPRIHCCAVMLSALLTGCGWLEDQPQEPDTELPVPLSIDEMLDTDADTPTGFQLEVGERFPLKRTVDQKLVQGGSVSHSRLELWLQLSVAERDDEQQTRLEARFLDVRYEHQIGEQKVAFDSRAVSGLEHAETRAYRGLVNNQFSFWIDADNQFVRLDQDFQSFLQGCLAGVPQAQRDVAYSMHVGRLGRPQVASFLDDGIGLLPPGELREMQQWTRPLMLPQPLPERIQLTCTLKTLKDRSAVVEFTGTVASAPAEPVFVRGHQEPAVSLQVLGGRCRGECVVDRETGLPLHSQRELMLDLVAVLPDGTRVPQQKTITSELKAFPETPPELPLGSGQAASRAAPEPADSVQPIEAAIPGADSTAEIPSAQY